MKKSKELRFERKLIHTLLLILTMWLTICAFTIVSHAQSEGKVTADTAKIRKEASTSSEVIGSAANNAKVSINGQVTGSDGNIWYQVYVDASTLGYIRSDLVSITDGSTPTTLSSSTTTTTAATTTTTTTTASETPADVTEVNPVSASVTGGQAVRVRSNASTTSSIVTTAESGLTVTVNGKATGSDGKEWYRVSFTVNGSEVTGFIRSDYINLSEELTEPGAETAATEPAENTESGQDTATETSSDKYAVALEGEDWYLIDNEQSGQYKIADIFSSVENNSKLYSEATKNIKSLKAVVIILIIVIIILAAVITMLVMKLREASDAAYYAEVDRANARRSADRPQGSQTGAGRSREDVSRSDRPRQSASRPAQNGQRTAQNTNRAAQNGQKAAQNTNRAAQNGQRAAQNTNRTERSGQKAAQNGQNTQRTAQGQQKVSQNAAQTEYTDHSENTNKDNNRQYNGRVVQRKPKNFMADDDEFEFEFLNWDGEDDK
jgi:hypothetical protein